MPKTVTSALPQRYGLGQIRILLIIALVPIIADEAAAAQPWNWQTSASHSACRGGVARRAVSQSKSKLSSVSRIRNRDYPMPIDPHRENPDFVLADNRFLPQVSMCHVRPAPSLRHLIKPVDALDHSIYKRCFP